MFPDSTIAKSFQLGGDKIRYMTNYGILPFFKGLLIDSLKKIDCCIFWWKLKMMSYNHVKWNYFWHILILMILQSKFVTIILDSLVMLLTKIF